MNKESLIALLGTVEGKIVSDIGVNKLAVITSKDRLELVEASALLSSFLTSGSGIAGLFLESVDLIDYDPHVVAIVSKDPMLIAAYLDTLQSISADVFLTFYTSKALEHLELPSNRDIYFIQYDKDSRHLLLLKWDVEPIVVFEYSFPAELLRLFEHEDQRL